jgi:hypothetical protein
MTRFLFVAAIACLFSTTASADTPQTTPTTPTAPVVSSTVPAPIVTNTLTTTPRRMGLFARIRARHTDPMLTTNASYTTTPMTTPGTIVPAPMPGIAPKPGTTSATPGVTGAPVVSGSSTMMPTPDMMTTTSTPQRMGLLARLRMRR